jgi:hypothetical protein
MMACTQSSRQKVRNTSAGVRKEECTNKMFRRCVYANSWPNPSDLRVETHHLCLWACIPTLHTSKRGICAEHAIPPRTEPFSRQADQFCTQAFARGMLTQMLASFVVRWVYLCFANPKIQELTHIQAWQSSSQSVLVSTSPKYLYSALSIVCVRTRYTVASYVSAHVTQWHRMCPHTLHSGTVCVRTRYTVAPYVSAHVTQWRRMCPHTLHSGIVCVRTRYAVASYASAHVTQWHSMCPHTLHSGIVCVRTHYAGAQLLPCTIIKESCKTSTCMCACACTNTCSMHAFKITGTCTHDRHIFHAFKNGFYPHACTGTCCTREDLKTLCKHTHTHTHTHTLCMYNYVPHAQTIG